MTVRFSKLFSEIETKGWTISKAEIDSNNWWAIAIYKLESRFSPVGKIAYLTLVMDESKTGELVTEDDAEQLGISAEHDTHCTSFEININIKRNFKKRLSEVPEILEVFRS